jgi:hypothetical protein
MPVHNCPNCPYTSHRPFDLRRHLRRKAPCNGINENTQTGTISTTLSEQNHVFDEHNTIYNKHNTVLSEQNATDTNKNKCQHCKKQFSNHSNYKSHVKNNKCRGCEPEVCKICLKRFNSTTARATHNRRVKCKAPSIPIPKINPVDSIPECSSNPNEFIYLIQLREFVRNNEPIYKIGRTKQSYEKRIKSYPRGSSLLFYHTVDDCVTTETNIKKYLGENFIQRRDLGLEYFEGDCKLIMNAIKQFL